MNSQQLWSSANKKIWNFYCDVIEKLTKVKSYYVYTQTHIIILGLSNATASLHLFVLYKKTCRSLKNISPCVSLPVVEVEPDQVELILEQPQVRAGLTFCHQVLMSPLWRNITDDVHESPADSGNLNTAQKKCHNIHLCCDYCDNNRNRCIYVIIFELLNLA